MPVCFDPSQIIEVEGNFSKYFDIYAPDGYGIEVLDILSPDLMALMIDNSSMFDIEIFGNRVYIRSREDCFDNPEKLRLIYKATQIILTNIYEEGRHWSFAVQPKNPPTLKYYPSEESIKLGNKRFSSGLLVIPLFTVLITFTFGGVSLFNLKTLAISLSIGITLMIIYRYLFRKPEQQKWK